MRSLATERFDLHILDPFLPDGSLDQSFDLIDMIRNFEAFIGKFNYSMTEQAFIERKPERGAKFLATFGVKCIAASINQHGGGIVGMAVDVTYKLLAQMITSSL
jgi:hypothetical protein